MLFPARPTGRATISLSRSLRRACHHPALRSQACPPAHQGERGRARARSGSMSLKCGIVGLPNVGKSTLFNALTKAGIAAENYPFCTIEPNVGVVEVPDPRLSALAELVQPQRVQPAIVEFVDIAGLV